MAFWMIPLALAAAGALADKEKPLRGAALGAAAGMTGGAAMGAMGGAGGLLGAGTAAGSGAGTAGSLLAAEGATAAGTAAAEGAAGGLLAGGEQAAMLAAQNAGLEGATAATNGALSSNAGLLGAQQAAAPVVNMNTSAGLFDKMNYQTNGLLGNTTDAYSKYGKPMGQVMNAAQQGQEMAAASDPQVQAAPPPQLNNQPLNLNETIGMGQQARQYEDAEALRRKQLMALYSSRIGGMS